MPSSLCSSISLTISSWLASEQVNMAVFATTTSGSPLQRGHHFVHIHVIGDVAPAVAHVYTQTPRAHAAPFLRSRYAAAWATAAPRAG